MFFLLVAAALVVGAPLAAVVLVSIASRREDAEHSLTGRPPGRITAIARLLLCSRNGTTKRTATRGGAASRGRPASRGRARSRGLAASGGRAGSSGRVPSDSRSTSTQYLATGRGGLPTRTGPEVPRPRGADDAATGSWRSGSAPRDTLTLPRT